jgi:hypothetical protein
MISKFGNLKCESCAAEGDWLIISGNEVANVKAEIKKWEFQVC